MIRAAILLDADRTDEELFAFSRLAVGLATEGVHSAIVQSVETDDLPSAGASKISAPIPTISVPRSVPFWLRRRMAGAVLERLREEGRGDPDVIVACGRGCLWLGEQMAQHVEVPLVLEIRSVQEANASDHRKVDTLVAATPNLRLHASRRHGDDFTTHLPVVVPRTMKTDDEGLAVALGPVGDPRRWAAMIEGLAGPGGPVHGMRHLALDLGSRRRDEAIWKQLRSSTIADRMSGFDHTDRMRGLLASAEVVIVPDRDRSVRSIEIQARINGGLIVAVEDEARDDRDPGIGDQLLSPAEARQPAAWRESIARAFSEAPSPGSRIKGQTSLVSAVAPRWAALLRDLVHGDATPINEG